MRRLCASTLLRASVSLVARFRCGSQSASMAIRNRPAAFEVNIGERERLGQRRTPKQGS